MILSFRKTGKIVEIPLVQIRPCRTQARQYYDVESLKALADSIRMNGILQPVTVRKVSALEYELIAGERRLRAAALCGYTRIPCIIMRHAQLNPQEAASYLGQQPETLSHKMELLKADDEEKQLMVKAHFTEKHIHAVLRVQDKTDRRIVMSEIIEGSMNVSQSEQYVSDYLENTAREKRRLQRKKGWLKDIRMFHNTIDKAVAALRVSGLAAETIQYDTGDSIEYVIRIPKTRQRMADCQEMTA